MNANTWTVKRIKVELGPCYSRKVHLHTLSALFFVVFTHSTKRSEKKKKSHHTDSHGHGYELTHFVCLPFRNLNAARFCSIFLGFNI